MNCYSRPVSVFVVGTYKRGFRYSLSTCLVCPLVLGYYVTFFTNSNVHQMLTVGGSGSHLYTGQRNGIQSQKRATVPPARIHNFKVHLWIGPGSDECFLEGGFTALIQAINF